MTIMLTVNPIIWGLAIHGCLLRCKCERRALSALICGSSMVVVSAVVDFIFFGLIRGAMAELYHPTTLNGHILIYSFPL